MGRSSIHVVIEGAEPPTLEAQEGFIRLMKGGHLACVGVVFLGNGFWASALRSNSTSMMLQSAASCDLRQHAAIQDLRWLPAVHASRIGITVDANELISVVQAFTTNV